MAEPQQPIVRVAEVCFAYGLLPILNNVTLTLTQGEVVALVGPSGCGKSTLLRVIAGLEEVQSGQLVIEKASNENSVNIAYMFQNYDAFPWLTVIENVRYGSGIAPYPNISTVRELLEQVGLSDSADKYPAELSGGMLKRLALARVLIRRPRLLLMDEPFASLDPDTRYRMYGLFQKLIASTQTTVMFVTHDMSEAIMLSNRVLVGSGRPMQIRSEIHVPLSQPRLAAVANSSEFLSSLQNLLSAIGLLHSQ